MKTTLATGRVLLDKEASSRLQQIMATLSKEGGHLFLSPSRIASWIISEFAEVQFQKDKEKLKEGLFNRKAFLKSMLKGLKSGSDEEILHLETTLKSLKSKPRRKLQSPSETLGKESNNPNPTDGI